MLCFVCKHEEHKKTKIKECKQCEKDLKIMFQKQRLEHLNVPGQGTVLEEIRWAIAEDAGAIIKIGKSVRVNFTILDKYMDALSGE